MSQKLCFITLPQILDEYAFVKELGKGGQARVDLFQKKQPMISGSTKRPAVQKDVDLDPEMHDPVSFGKNPSQPKKLKQKAIKNEEKKGTSVYNEPMFAVKAYSIRGGADLDIDRLVNVFSEIEFLRELQKCDNVA